MTMMMVCKLNTQIYENTCLAEKESLAGPFAAADLSDAKSRLVHMEQQLITEVQFIACKRGQAFCYARLLGKIEAAYLCTVSVSRTSLVTLLYSTAVKSNAEPYQREKTSVCSDTCTN